MKIKRLFLIKSPKVKSRVKISGLRLKVFIKTLFVRRTIELKISIEKFVTSSRSLLPKKWRVLLVKDKMKMGVKKAVKTNEGRKERG